MGVMGKQEALDSRTSQIPSHMAPLASPVAGFSIAIDQ